MIYEFIRGSTFFSTFGQGEFSPLLQNFSIALLTILIPVALAIFQNKDNGDFSKMVVVRGVLKLDDLLLGVFLCFFPTIFWVFFTSNWFRLILFILWVFGCKKLISIYLGNFRWLKGQQEDMKYEYIKSLKYTNSNFIEAYELVWRTSDSLKYRERDYLDLFSLQLEDLLEKEEYILIQELVDAFFVHLDKRTPSQLIFSKNLLKSLLKVHKVSWYESYKLMGSEDNINLWGDIEEVFGKTEDLIHGIFVLSFKNRHSVFFMNDYIESINSNLGLLIRYGKNTYRYSNRSISSFIQVLFSNQINKEDTYGFWRHEFPSEWKITALGLTGTHSSILWQIIDDYVRWVSEEFHKDNKDYKVDSLTRNLFPEIDPMIWLPLLDFSLHSYGESRVASMIQRKQQYGLIGRVRTYSGSPPSEEVSADFANDREKTYELIYSIGYFKKIFELDRLEEYFSDLEKYRAQNDSESRNKDWLVGVFREMNQYLQSLRKD